MENILEVPKKNEMSLEVTRDKVFSRLHQIFF